MNLFNKETAVIEGKIIAQTNDKDWFVVESSSTQEIYLCQNDADIQPDINYLVYFSRETIDNNDFFNAGVIRTAYDPNRLQFSDNKDLEDCSKSDVLKKWHKNLPVDEDCFNSRTDGRTRIYTGLSQKGVFEMHKLMRQVNMFQRYQSKPSNL